MDIDIDLIKKADLRHEQLKDTLDLLKKVKQQSKVNSKEYRMS